MKEEYSAISTDTEVVSCDIMFEGDDVFKELVFFDAQNSCVSYHISFIISPDVTTTLARDLALWVPIIIMLPVVHDRSCGIRWLSTLNLSPVNVLSLFNTSVILTSPSHQI